MAEAGRPSDLTEEVIAKIKESMINGETLKDFSLSSGISYSTITDWTYKNYRNLSDKIEGWKRDRKLMLAEKNIEALLSMPFEDKETMKVVADMSKFVAETLGKGTQREERKTYSKRVESTGAEGGPIAVVKVTDKELDELLLSYADRRKEIGSSEENLGG